MNIILSNWLTWAIWSVLCVTIVRLSVFWLLKKIMAARSALMNTYVLFPIFFIVGLVLVGFSGMPMYGFDRESASHWFGYYILFYSPMGLPLLLGSPVLLVVDAIRKPWRS